MIKKQIKIMSTYQPKEVLDLNTWCEQFKVGSRVYNKIDNKNAKYMNEDYDFTKLFKNTEELGFFGRLKSLKLADLW